MCCPAFALVMFGKIVESFDAGDLAGAAEWQARANRAVELMCRYNTIAGIKEMLTLVGVNAGPCRLPNGNLTPAQKADTKAGFFELFPSA